MDLPPSARPRRRWWAIAAMLVLGAAVLTTGMALRRPPVTVATVQAPVSRPEPASLFRVTMGQGVDASRRGALAEARRLFERALELNGGSAEGWNNLGVVLIRQGEMASGIAALRNALRVSPTHAEAHRNLAVALEHQGEPLEATRHYLYFLSLSEQAHPERAEVGRRLGASRRGSDEWPSW